VVRVLAAKPSVGARNTWTAELALVLVLKRRAARPGSGSVTVESKSAAACRWKLQQLHASFQALAALDSTAAEACEWALELFWPPTTVAAAARKAVAARERSEPDDRLPVGTRVLINGLQANTEFNCRGGEVHHRECIGGVERYANRLDDENPVLIWQSCRVC
jgi:hypothetical protein